jgi:predicted metal-binding protein
MADGTNLDALFEKHGLTDYRWIDPKGIAVAHWVRMKCIYGCEEYGRNSCCPPNVPAVAECRQFLDEYSRAAILHFEKVAPDREERRAWSRAVNDALMKLERDVFLAGHVRAFALPMSSCSACAECIAAREECRNPRLARPTPEALAIDVFTTARQAGYPIHVLTDRSAAMQRYAFLLVE